MSSNVKTCFFWDRFGECKHGEGCRLLHRKTNNVAAPPKTWTDYNDKGPPKRPKTYASTKGSVRGDSSEVGNNFERNTISAVEDQWEKAVPPVMNDWNSQPSSTVKKDQYRESVEDEWENAIPPAANDWDEQSSAVGKEQHQERVDEEWDQAPPNPVDNWNPPTPNSNTFVATSSRYPASVAASNTPARYPSSVANHDHESVAASSALATSTTPADYDDNSVIVIEDVWDTLLPPEFAEYTTIKRKYGTSDSEFEIDTLAVLLSTNPFRLLDVEQYLNSYPEKEVRASINARSSKITSLFFAVATGEPKALKLIIEKGGDVNSTAGVDSIPVLAFAIMHGSREDTTEIVRILLAYGANSTVIPDEFTSLDNHGSSIPKSALNGSPASSSTKWCSEKYREKLASTINISQRYWLAKSRQQHPRAARELMVAREEHFQKLFQIPYSLIGQELAMELLVRRISSHLLLSKSATKPLVIVFAGASGHGKTELTKCIGELLSVESLVVDSTEMTNATDLLGPKAPYPGYEEGSALNNFLCRNHGQYSIVFLDNFEKLGPSVCSSLLTPFGEGKYHDRRTTRNDAEIDCSKVIWILSTSNVDNIIEPYYRANIEVLQSANAQDHQVVINLVKEIEDKFLKRLGTEYGASFSGRISLVLPFFPFSPIEQAVIAHKYILELKGILTTDINVAKGELMRHINLEVEGESAVCTIVAKKGYDIEYGARSIEREVQKTVHDVITQEWLKSSDEIINQNNSGPYERYSLAIHSSGEYIHVKRVTGAIHRREKARAKAKAKAKGKRVKQNGGVHLGTSSTGRLGTPMGSGKKPLPKVGRLIDIGGELVKAGWDD